MNKAAMVTGASDGIGRAVAGALAREGHAVTLVSRREEALRQVAAELPGAGHRVLVADLSTDAGMERVARDLAEVCCDVLVNNAGSGLYGVFQEASLEKQRAMMRLNMDALTVLSHAFLRQARSGDALINISSTLSYLPMPASPVYAATKAFVTSLSESLWFSNKDRGVYVAAVCPGPTVTNFAHAAGGRPEERAPRPLAQTPEVVASAVMRALVDRREPCVVCGGINQLMVLGGRMLPSRVRVNLMGLQKRTPRAE